MKFKSRVLSCSLLLAASFVSAPALAQLSPSTMADQIDSWLANNSTSEAMVWQGKTHVEDGGGHYRVTMPSLSVLGDTSRFDFGKITANVKPKTLDTWEALIALPRPLAVRTPDEEVIAAIDYQEQNVTGLWDAKHGIFRNLNMRLQDVRVMDYKKMNSARAASVTAYQAVQPTGETWQADYEAKLQNIRLGSLEKEGNNISIGEVKVSGQVKGIAEAFLAQIMAPQSWQMQNMETPYTSSVNAVSFHNMVSETIDGSRFGIDKVEVTLDEALDLTSGFGNYALKVNMTGGSMMGGQNQIIETASNMAPKHLLLDVSVSELPVNKLRNMADQMKEDIAPAIENLEQGEAFRPRAKEGVEVAIKGHGTKMFDTLKQAQSVLEINDMSFSGEGYDFKASGKLQANPDAAKGFVGQMTFVMTGLQETMNDMMMKPGTPEEKQGRMMIMMPLSMAASLGETSPAPEGGRTQTVFNVSIPMDGGILVNGQPVGGMLPSSKRQ